jgi:D-xylose transport system substrate-binding protein
MSDESKMRARVVLVIFSCALSVLTGLVLCRQGGSAGRQPVEARRPLIGFSLDTLKEERWRSDRDFFVRRAAELGADVLVQAANSDDARQMRDVEALISRKVDVLVIVPHNGAAMAKAVRLAHESGIPVIAYDRLIPDCDLDLYVSFDSIRVGQAQARYAVGLPSERLLKRSGRTIKIVRIHGSKTDPNAFLVKRGQDEVLEPYLKRGEAVVVHEDWAEGWKPENAKKITQAAIARVGPGFHVVLAANDGTAGGAVQALMEEGEGLAGRVFVTGQDAELAACQRIVNGTQAMTVYKPLKALAQKAAEAAVKMAQGRTVVAREEVDNGKVRVPSILMEVLVATKDNMASTVIRDGFHASKDVYGHSPPAR